MNNEIVDPEDTLNKQIDAAFTARENSGTPWAAQYWDNVLGAILRKANRIASSNYYLN